ncbi:septal ring lytic transglycosylase RlpA family protein [Actinobacillus pleuropneumoniae]|uniref:Endolytic peptidoglycan transglycosylase RlpA n=2 Tax=Actinobacillus pleuropneumoniae TaxID=715 RepID=B0BRS3_ACTPJ|nr:septal ring lytic transglycosylase RlpA family protein [Actinobacillus pleuropneumoniae]ABY70182.1 possible rare lipoprotein A [Actinobacillus pleuropneumoniae serovar 3 str. JL03]EFL77917.1 rare lipoprotein A [Actinobacillus pleuropneumoniae serovar 2 str. 4226]KIE89164.1 putative rare lipoprotein A [Actinobacillus pleuropneumoniae]KIE89269.1 putative rare lipoprotein A [Actinobacillus pleuropneumoniae]KIE89371.1 putative rare lipoprotein A [Actinobacillus pleuropneumoniae]
MRLSKMVTLLLAGFLTFGSLNSVAATKNAKPSAVKKYLIAKTAKKSVQNAALTAKARANKIALVKKRSLKEQHKHTTRSHYQSGVASYYADKFNGRRTANGERFSNSAMTAAHKTLPFGTLVEVTNTRNGRSVVVRVNDRGPYAHARVVDLSKAAARQLGMYSSGTAHVKLAVLNKKATSVASEEDI